MNPFDTVADVVLSGPQAREVDNLGAYLCGIVSSTNKEAGKPEDRRSARKGQNVQFADCWQLLVAFEDTDIPHSSGNGTLKAAVWKRFDDVQAMFAWIVEDDGKTLGVSGLIKAFLSDLYIDRSKAKCPVEKVAV